MTGRRRAAQSDCSFLVDLGAGQAPGGGVGFVECTIAGVDLAVDPIREDGDLESLRSRIGSLDEPGQVTLKGGVIDSDHLTGWLGADRTQVRTVRVALLSDDRTTTLAAWVLEHSRILRFVGAPLEAEGNDLAVSELTLTCDGIALEDPGTAEEQARSPR